MRDLLRQLAIVFILLALGNLASAAPPPLPDLSTFPDSLGVNIHFTDPKPGELDQIYAAGFRWVRMDFQWAGIEQKKGEYDFAAYDRLVKALDEHHMHGVFILDYGNRHYDNDLSPNSDEGRAAFAKWAAASVHHFAGHGILWEMWNEPNGGFWKPKANVDDYAKLALETGKAIRVSEPGEIYIGPATSTIDMAFLEACFKAGCLEYWSAVSVHPYRQKDPETVAGEYRALRALIAKYAPNDRKIPIISGEWGYSSVWKDFDEDRQAKYLPREMLTNIANDVPLSIWYDWHEDGKNPKEAEHHFGIVRPDVVNRDGNLYEPKKAYLAMQRMGETLKGYRFNKRLAIGGEDYYVLLFDNAEGKTLLVSWTTSDAKLDVPLPITGGAIVRRTLGSADTNLPANAKGIRVTPDDLPMYIIPVGDEELLRIAAAWSRAPSEISVVGPGRAKVETTARNPLEHSITLLVENRKTVVKPGATLTLTVQTLVTRSDVASRLLATIDVEGLGRVAQRIDCSVTNPLIAISFPRIGDTQQVRIENPAGDAIHAKATLTGAQEIMVDRKLGETELVLTFKFNESVPKETTNRFVRKRFRADGQLILTDGETRTLLEANFGKWVYLTIENTVPPNYKLIADGDPKVISQEALSDAAPPEGPPAAGVESVKISYSFGKGWKFLRLAPRDQPTLLASTKFGIWVHGDAQGNVARMRFTDSTGQTFQPDGGRITWTGWRYVEFPFAGHDLAHWGGANDGTVHFPVHIDTLFLLDSPNREATHGQIYLSTPTLIYSK